MKKEEGVNKKRKYRIIEFSRRAKDYVKRHHLVSKKRNIKEEKVIYFEMDNSSIISDPVPELDAYSYKSSSVFEKLSPKEFDALSRYVDSSDSIKEVAKKIRRHFKGLTPEERKRVVENVFKEFKKNNKEELGTEVTVDDYSSTSFKLSYLERLHSEPLLPKGIDDLKINDELDDMFKYSENIDYNTKENKFLHK